MLTLRQFSAGLRSDPYIIARNAQLEELKYLRAMVRVGNRSVMTGRREQKLIQLRMVRLRNDKNKRLTQSR